MKDVAYTVSITKDGGYTLGIAKRDEPGYYQTNYAPVATWEQAEKWADTANERLGLTREEALDIITSSMRAQNLRGKRGL